MKQRSLNFSAEWNRAEGAIKLTEQVNGEIINPAIYELRYAGRRRVEAFAVLSAGKKPEALHLLRDASFDCCRARHDAIDAATSKVVTDLEIAITKLGPEPVLASFPEFPHLFGLLGEVRDQVAISRENRTNRDEIYATLEATNLPDIIQSYRRFRANEGIMRQFAKRQRRNRVIDRTIGIVGAIAAVGALAAYLIFENGCFCEPQGEKVRLSEEDLRRTSLHAACVREKGEARTGGTDIGTSPRFR